MPLFVVHLQMWPLKDQIAHREEYYLSLCCSPIKAETNLVKNVAVQKCALWG